MPDYITLLGAEQVKSAANTMSNAAERMASAASTIYDSNERLIRALQEHADRVEHSLEEKQP